MCFMGSIRTEHEPNMESWRMCCSEPPDVETKTAAPGLPMQRQASALSRLGSGRGAWHVEK